jgi:hypothetical protein
VVGKRDQPGRDCQLAQSREKPASRQSEIYHERHQSFRFEGGLLSESNQWRSDHGLVGSVPRATLE